MKLRSLLWSVLNRMLMPLHLVIGEKEVAKEAVERFANDVAQMLKVTMKQSGKIV